MGDAHERARAGLAPGPSRCPRSRRVADRCRPRRHRRHRRARARRGVVIDEFAVNLADVDLLPVLIKEVEEVDGASVEEVRTVGRFPDPRLDALESAAALCEAPTTAALGEHLVTQTRQRVPGRVERADPPRGAARGGGQCTGRRAARRRSPSVRSPRRPVAEGETGPGRPRGRRARRACGAVLLVGSGRPDVPAAASARSCSRSPASPTARGSSSTGSARPC